MRLLAVSMVSVEWRTRPRRTRAGASAHYFAELGERFEEPFDPARTLPAEPQRARPADRRVPRRAHERPAGGLRWAEDLAPDVGELMRMWVDGAHRGLGIGKRHPRRARGRSRRARPRAGAPLHQSLARRGEGDVPRRRLRRDRPLQRRSLRGPLVREAPALSAQNNAYNRRGYCFRRNGHVLLTR